MRTVSSKKLATDVLRGQELERESGSYQGLFYQSSSGYSWLMQALAALEQIKSLGSNERLNSDWARTSNEGASKESISLPVKEQKLCSARAMMFQHKNLGHFALSGHKSLCGHGEAPRDESRRVQLL